MPNYIVPTAAEMREIAQDLMPELTQDDPIFDEFPITEAEEELLIWEQEDNFVGLQQIRGMGGSPGRVSQVGVSRYQALPGIYGDVITLNEQDILRRRKFGTFGEQIDLKDLVLRRQMQLLQRRIWRIKTNLWQTAQGSYSVTGPGGQILISDTWNPQTYASAVAWSTSGTATPLLDFRTVKTLHRGHSVAFNSTAVARMNQTTFNRMVNNTNSADLYGRRTAGFATPNNLADLNRVFAGDDLPQIEIYDDFYLSDGTDGYTKGQYVMMIPNNVVVVFGKRPAGQRIGEYRMTLNLENPGAGPGAYTKVILRDNDGPPTSVEVHDGHNGGPVISYPSALVVMTVGTKGA